MQASILMTKLGKAIASFKVSETGTLTLNLSDGSSLTVDGVGGGWDESWILELPVDDPDRDEWQIMCESQGVIGEDSQHRCRYDFASVCMTELKILTTPSTRRFMSPDWSEENNRLRNESSGIDDAALKRSTRLWLHRSAQCEGDRQPRGRGRCRSWPDCGFAGPDCRHGVQLLRAWSKQREL